MFYVWEAIRSMKDDKRKVLLLFMFRVAYYIFNIEMLICIKCDIRISSLHILNKNSLHKRYTKLLSRDCDF